MSEPWFNSAADLLRSKDSDVFDSLEAELRFYAWIWRRRTRYRHEYPPL